jgi:hypothetical protein
MVLPPITDYVLRILTQSFNTDNNLTSIYKHLSPTMSKVFWCKTSRHPAWAAANAVVRGTSRREREEMDSTGNICMGLAVDAYERERLTKLYLQQTGISLPRMPQRNEKGKR